MSEPSLINVHIAVATIGGRKFLSLDDLLIVLLKNGHEISIATLAKAIEKIREQSK